MTGRERIAARFAARAAEGRALLIPFVTAGDPSLEATVPVMHALVDAGADLIELGVPFSDPMADGPVIQRASERALARGATLARVLGDVARFRERDRDTPVVLMGYLNPIEIRGIERFASEARTAGVDGVLLVDVPPEEAATTAPLAAAGLARIALVAPTTDPERAGRIAAVAEGFLYYVSFAGITGADRLSLDAVREPVAHLRAMAQVPVALGFGIRTPEQAAAAARFADAVVVGSALVEALAASPEPAALAAEFLRPLRAALDHARRPLPA